MSSPSFYLTNNFKTITYSQFENKIYKSFLLELQNVNSLLVINKLTTSLSLSRYLRYTTLANSYSYKFEQNA